MVESSRIGKRPSPLCVTWVAAKAAPSRERSLVSGIGEGGMRGLAAFVGKVPATLTYLGADVNLVLPACGPTLKAIKEKGYPVEWNICELEVEMRPGIRLQARVHKMYAPTEVSYPIYLIDEPGLFSRRENIYGYGDDLQRFKFLLLGALELEPWLNRIPTIMEAHAGDLALLPTLKEEYRLKYPGHYNRTKFVLAVHDFLHPGQIYYPAMSSLTTLEMGLLSADIAYARSHEQISAVLAGRVDSIAPGIKAVVWQRFTRGELPYLSTVDEFGKVDEVSLEQVDAAGRRVLGVYRQVVEEPFEYSVMDKARPPFYYSSLAWEVKVVSPRDHLEKLGYMEMLALYDDLAAPTRKKNGNVIDRGIIDEEIMAGRAERFAEVSTKRELDGILAFLKIAPKCNFEELLAATIQKASEKKVGEDPVVFDQIDFYKSGFFPGDLDRMLSTVFQLERSKNSTVQDEFQDRPEATLFEIFDKLGIISHSLNIFSRLNSFVQSPERSIEILSEKSQLNDDQKARLRTLSFEFRTLSDNLNRLSRDRRAFPAFIAAVTFHEIGRCIEEEMHPEKGTRMLKEVLGYEIGLDKEQQQFARNIVLYQELFIRNILVEDIGPAEVEKVFRVYQYDRGKRCLFLDSLLLIGIAHVISAIEEGEPVDYLMLKEKLRNIFKIYKAAINSEDLSGLWGNMAEIGLAPEKFGNERWNKFIVGEAASDDQDKKEQNRNRHLVRKVLLHYLRRRDKTQKVSITDFKMVLGSIDRFHGLNDVLNQLEDPLQKARLIIRIVELFRYHESKLQQKEIVISFLKEDLPYLKAILQKAYFTWEYIMVDFTHEQDPEEGYLKIKISNPERVI